jgi:hypothetical protein
VAADRSERAGRGAVAERVHAIGGEPRVDEARPDLVVAGHDDVARDHQDIDSLNLLPRKRRARGSRRGGPN